MNPYAYNPDLGLQQSALQYISECLSEAPDMVMYYPRYTRVQGISHLGTQTLYKLIGIMHHSSFGKGRFVSELCAGNDGPRSYAKARIDSIYHFMPLADELGMDGHRLYAILRGLPHNRKRFVNCSLPVRSKEVESYIRFIDALLKTDHRRGISVLNYRDVRINSEELSALVSKHHHEIDRLIKLYCEEGTPLGRVVECMAAPLALQEGAL